MGLLEGKKILVLGVANERSLAWGVVKSLRANGAKIAMTYIEAMQSRVEPLAEQVEADFVCKVDVTNDEDLQALKDKVSSEWGEIDGLVHSLAFADKASLRGRFSDISRAQFMQALDISSYSLIALCQTLRDQFSENSSVITMTYEGSVKIVNGYNLMGVAKAALESSMRYLADDLGEIGVRVNAISAGPIKTLAASGVGGLSGLMKMTEKASPLKRNVNIDDIGGTSSYLLSDLSSGVTGQVLFVDGGASVTLMENRDK